MQPRLRFKFHNSKEYENFLISNIRSEKLSNGVFNDPRKVGSGYKLINVSDMYIETTIDDRSLSQISLSKKEFETNKVYCEDIFFTRSSLVKEGIAHSNIYLGKSDGITFDGHLIRLRVNTEIVYPLYLHYLLKTHYLRRQLIKGGKTTTMTTIGQADIDAVELYIPKIEEQTKIASFLSVIDEKITQLTKKHKLLTQYKKGAMQKIFNQELRFKADDESDYPDWSICFLKEILESIGSGGTPKSTNLDYYNGGIPWVSITDMTEQGKFIVKTKKTLSENGLKNSSARLFPAGTVLYAMYASIGEVSIASLEVTTSQAILGIQPNPNNLVNEYLYHWLVSIKDKVMLMGQQGTQSNLNLDIVKHFKIPLPVKTEQTKIANFLSAIDEKINNTQFQLEASKKYKQGLLQQMFV